MNVAGDLQSIAIVAAADCVGARWRAGKLCRAPLRFVLEAAEREQVRIDAIIRLRIDEVAIGYGKRLVRIITGELKDRLTDDTEPIRSSDGDRCAKKVSKRIRNTGRRKIVELRTQT